MSAVDRIWRLAATAISFALFGLGGIFLALVVFPVLNGVVRDRDRRAAIAQQIVHKVWRLYVWAICAIGTVSLDVHGAEVLRRDRGVLVIANHPSLLDIVFIMSLMERTQCVVKSAVWRNLFMHAAVTAANYVPNFNDPERLIDDCVSVLKAGHNLVIFPEGSRTPADGRLKFHRGFVYIALRSGAPIRIVTINCAPRTLLKGEPWYHIPKRRPRWTLRVHEELFWPLADGAPGVAARRLCSQIERYFEEALAS